MAWVKKRKSFSTEGEKKRALERKATSWRSLSLGLTKVNPSLKVVDFSIKISFHLVCCLKRVGLCSFDRFGKSFEIRVSKLFGKKSISGFFAFVDMVSKQF